MAIGDVADRPDSVGDVRDLAAERLLRRQLLKKISAAPDALPNFFLVGGFSDKIFSRFLVQSKGCVLVNNFVHPLERTCHSQDVFRRQEEEDQLDDLSWEPIKPGRGIFFGSPDLLLPPSQALTPRHCSKNDLNSQNFR